MDALFAKLSEIFTAQILDVGGNKFSIAAIILSLSLIVLTFFAANLTSEMIRRSLLVRLRINRGLQNNTTD